jgi:hypothetical protein
MSDKKQSPMTPQDASRIQSNTDKTGADPAFKKRAQSAGDKNGKVPIKK